MPTSSALGCFDIPELPVLPLCKFGFTRLQQVCSFTRQQNWQQSRRRALPFVLGLSPILRHVLSRPKAKWLALAVNERLVFGSWSQLTHIQSLELETNIPIHATWCAVILDTVLCQGVKRTAGFVPSMSFTKQHRIKDFRRPSRSNP